MTEPQRLTGRCLCEGIAYEISGELGPIFNCHCSKCRRWHGAAFRTRASIKRQQFRWLQGEDLLARYESSPGNNKHFCSRCGSNLISTYDDYPDVIGIPLGGLEQDPGVRPQAHIFTASKSPWVELDDDLPCFEAWPQSQGTVRATHDG